MKTTAICFSAFTCVTCLLTGCSDSSSTSNGGANTTPAAAPAPAVPEKKETPASEPAPAPIAAPAPAVTATATETATEPVTQFAQTAEAQPDKVAASIGSELATKAKALTQSAQSNPELKTQLNTSLQSLSAGKDAAALTTLFPAAQGANLTSQQVKLAKEVGNLASAYVAQRNFASLEGSQSDVATLVNALRKGEVSPAVPALEKLAQNASLTPAQKDLVGTLADKYAPGLKKASDSLKQGLQGLQGLGK